MSPLPAMKFWTVVLISFSFLFQNGDAAAVLAAMAPMIDGMLGTDPTQCPAGWVTAPTSPCICIYIENGLSGLTYMSTEEYCMKVDNRSRMAAFSTQAEMTTFNGFVGPYSSMLGGSNVPVAFYKSTNGDVRSTNTQNVLPAFDPPMDFQCQYFIEDATNTGSCLQSVTVAACSIPCDNPPQPPPPTVTDGGPRCGDPTYMSNCPSGFTNLGGVCYMNPSNVLQTYTEADAACKAAGGWLPSFSNMDEWLAVKNYAYTTGIAGADSFAAPMWLGGTLSGTTGTWTDGTPWQFQNWAPNEPASASTSTCMWWSIGNGGYWSRGDCAIPGVVFCQYFDACPTTTMPTTTTMATTTASTTTTTATTTTLPMSTAKMTTTMKPTTQAKTTLAASTRKMTTMAAMANGGTTTNMFIPVDPILTVGTCTHKLDFSAKCLASVPSYFADGICYRPGSNCTAINGRLAIVRDADVAEMFLENYYNQITTPPPYTFYIGSYNKNPSTYMQIDGMVSSSGAHKIKVELGFGKCLAIVWANEIDDVYTITDNIPCGGSPSSMCEMLPTFERKGCDQMLAEGHCTVEQAMTSLNVTDCAKQCSYLAWCAGVNYNEATQMCYYLTENSSTNSIVCTPSMLYYERIV